MSTNTHITGRSSRRAWLILAAGAAAAAAAFSLVVAPSHRLAVAERSPVAVVDDDDVPGSALPVTGTPAPDAIEAAFSRRSYGPGETATLRVFSRIRSATLRVFEAGHGHEGVLQGAPVTAPISVDRPTYVRMRVGDWPSGLYYVRLSGPGGRYGYAPFVLRPRRLGEHRVAVVLPTNTWQAYNFFDQDGDHRPDSWYGNRDVSCVRLTRPFLDHGVPPHYAGYDRGFLRWLARSEKNVDVLSDDDFERIASGRELARTYDLIVFSGHEEYVTAHAFVLAEGFRDRGGNLMFLSANNFFYRVDRHGDALCRTGRWRDLGRPEARLVGIQYVDWYQGRYKNRPYVVTGGPDVAWAFHGTGLHRGGHFGNYGIEIDARTPDSPRGTRILARIPNIFGPHKTAEMSYYTTPAGAKVFAAGVINFGGTALLPTVSPLLENVWQKLSRP